MTKKRSKDDENDFIEVYEVHGELDARLLQDNPDITLEDKDIKYTQQMHVVSVIESKEGDVEEFSLYRGREAKDPYMITHLIPEDGRTLSIGAVEYLFDAQWMQNHTVKNMKDTLDISSKLIFQTSDSRYLGRNVLSAIETGDIFLHKQNMPLTRLANDKPDISALQNFGIMWQNLGQEITSTPEALRGTTMPSGTPYSLGAFLGSQANSLFEIMVENKGLYLEDMIRKYINPYIRKKLKNKDQIVAILEDSGIAEIDARYIPKKAVEQFNKRTIDTLLEGGIPSPFVQEEEEQVVREQLGPQGNKRFFKPDEIGKKQWDEVFSDFAWDNIRVEVTNESVDKGAVFQTLSTVLQSIASNPQILQDPNAKTIFNAILRETGRISPIQLSTAQAQPPQPQPGQAPQLQLPSNQLNDGATSAT
jgi:hypothetical protein